jgi:hypothetical protein
MEKPKNRKTPGRPALAEGKKRQKVTLRLNQEEMHILQKEYEGHTVGFSVFCREKLMNREARTLYKPLDEGIRAQLTHLLQVSGRLSQEAHKTRDTPILSEDFLQMAVHLKEIIQRVHYSVNEIAYGQSLLIHLHTTLESMKALLEKLRQKWPEDEAVGELSSLQVQLLAALRSHLALYNFSLPFA